MRIRIIGAVAAGTSAAAKARRNSEESEIVVYEKDDWISYSGCGMPYFLGGEVEDAKELTPRDPAFFRQKYNIDIKTRHEVVDINPQKKSLLIIDHTSGKEIADSYDRLIIATGASPFIPPIPGVNSEHVFALRNIAQMYDIHTFMQQRRPAAAVIIGSGFVGLELCESFIKRGLQVQLVEKLPKLTPGLDADMAAYLRDHLEKHGLGVHTSADVRSISPDSILLADGTVLPADLVIVATGVRPNTELACKAGVRLGETGAIQVDEHMRTNINDVFACGDCSEQFHVVTMKPVYRPLGSTANKTGRIAGDCAGGGNLAFRGILGTGIFAVLGATVAQTGLSQGEAEKLGYETVVCHNTKPNKPEYMSGETMTIKGVADAETGRLLGVQIFGREGVDKRIDVFATAISFGARVEDLFHLDLAYAPPFSTTKDPVMYTGMILDNALHNKRPLVTAEKLQSFIASGRPLQIIDTRVQEQYESRHIEKAQNIPHADFRNRIASLQPHIPTFTYCNKGVTGNATQNILLNKGFSQVYNLSGGHKHYKLLNDSLKPKNEK